VRESKPIDKECIEGVPEGKDLSLGNSDRVGSGGWVPEARSGR
jgi:hypothetical protein